MRRKKAPKPPRSGERGYGWRERGYGWRERGYGWGERGYGISALARVARAALDRAARRNDTADNPISPEREGASLVTVQQLIELMQRQAWRLERVENDVRHFSHDSIPQHVTISGKLELLVPPGTLRAFLRSIRLEDGGDALRGNL